MAEEVVINIAVDADKAAEETARLTTELDKLLEAQREVTEARKAGNITAAEAKIKNKELADQIGFVMTKLTGLKKAQETAKKTADDYGDSLNDERRKLLDMQKAFAALTKAERESAAGKEFQKKIKEQHDAVLELEKTIGQAQRNVGNYAEDMSKALGGVGGQAFGVVGQVKQIVVVMKNATSGAKGFGGALKVLSSIGIVALFAGIVAIVKKFIDVFKGSEERTNALKKAFAPLSAIFDYVSRGVEKFCDILANIFVGSLEAVISSITWLAEGLDAIGEFFGQDWHLAERLKKAEEQANSLEKLEQDYVRNKRKWVVEEAKLENELALLKEKAADKEKYSAKQRLNYLKQANDKELEIMSGRKKLAEDNLKILEKNAERGQNDAEANDAIAEAKAEVIRQETEYYEKQKTLLKLLNSARAEIAAEQKSRLEEERNYWEAIDKEREAEIDAEIADFEKRNKAETDAMTNQLKEVEAQLQKRRETLLKFGLITAPSALDMELELLNKAYEDDLVTFEEYEEAKALITEKYEEKNRKEQEKTLEQAKQKYLEAKSTYAAAGVQGFNALSEAVSTFAGENEKANAAAQAFALGAVLAQEAQAIADGARAIAAAEAGAAEAAAAGGPAAPALLASYSASMVGAVVSVIASTVTSIANAKKILSQAEQSTGKYANGGIVGGTSYTGDKLRANVNSREMILNLGQQKRLFDIANGGQSAFNYEAFAQSVAAAVATAPAPILSLREFDDFQNRVTNIKEITKI